MKKLFFLSILFLMPQGLFSQAPQAFNYQAIARDTSGKVLVDKAISVQIEILDQSGVIYVEDHNVITNQFGLINLKVGMGTPVQNTFSSIDWSNGTYYIAVSIDPNGGSNFTNVGSAQLLSVPYALYARQSGNSYLNKSSNNLYYDQGNVGIGTKTPDVKLRIEDSITGSADKALIRLRNKASDGSTGVSIALESNDKSTVTALTHTSSSYTTIPDFSDMGVISTNGKGFSIYSSSSYGSIRFYTNDGTNGVNERMRINPSGEVSIGTSTAKASAKLTINNIYNDSNGGGFGLYATQSTDNAYLQCSMDSRVCSSGTWSSQGQASGISGNLTLEKDNAASIDTRSQGGFFNINLDNYSGIGNMTHYLSGCYGKIQGTISAYPTNKVISGVIGEDAVNSQYTYAGYFIGRGYFSGNVGIGVTNPQRSLQIKDVMRLEPISTPPSSPAEGDIYMDATTHKLMVYDGTQWQACW